jgi:hypothetical protein
MRSHIEPTRSSTSKMMNVLTGVNEFIWRPKKWTFFNSILLTLTALLNTAFYFGQTYDIFDSIDGDEIEIYLTGLSFYAFFVAVSLSPVLTTGPVYSYVIAYQLSNYTEEQEEKAKEEPDNPPVTRYFDPAKLKLTPLQYLFLFFDFISHSCDGAGTPLLIFSLTLPNAQAQEKIICQCMATAAGMIGAMDEVIKCRINMRAFNQMKLEIAAEKQAAEAPPRKAPPKNFELVEGMRQLLIDNVNKPNFLLQLQIAKKELSLFTKNYINTRPTVITITDEANNSYQLLGDSAEEKQHSQPLPR